MELRPVFHVAGACVRRDRRRLGPAGVDAVTACCGSCPPPPAKEYDQQFLVAGSWFHGVHGLAFNKDDQLFAGSVVGQTLYRVQVDSGEVDRFIDPPMGMADDIAFAEDGTMAWTAFLLGKVYIRRPNGKTIEVANGMGGPNSLAFGKDGRLFVSEVFIGDALYEIDIKNADKPDFKPFPRTELRRIAEKLGGLNGFEIHKDDGFLYGPLWFKGQVVKINLETGGIEVIAEGFKIPAAANIDPQNRDNVYVVDTGTGGIWSVSLTSKAKKLVASMKPGLDNLAFDSRGRLFVTSMTDNGIYLVDKQTGGAQHHRRGQARRSRRSRRRLRRRQGHGARRRRVQLSHRRRPDRRGARRDPRAWRDARLSASASRSAPGTCC